jgi:hypothetical protein
MASDYQAIRRENERRYGTDIGRIGPMLLADRYDDRTHFIFELLQNAEDALARRMGWSGRRSVRFHLTNHELRVSHFGKPFDEADVRGICGIAEGTKDLTAIGRFGIGFKSVYAFTERPEIHSGEENFAVENFVWPVAVPPLTRETDETIILIPLESEAPTDYAAIASGLQRLGARALMFLREIEEMEWAVDGGPSGLYLRSQPEVLGEGVRHVTVIGEERGTPGIEESWLVFSRPVTTADGVSAGNVELGFSVVNDGKTGEEKVSAVAPSPLVVFFPTVLETHLGFLVQGPYRTTPSRDNVPRHDPWNQYCVQQTAVLLAEALCWLRDHDLLDSEALRCLPLDRAKFGEGAMFAPLFDETKRLLVTEPLLPRFGGGYATAASSKLARTQELRELFDPVQLGTLLGGGAVHAWLSADISQDRTPELRQYLMQELGIPEITPETMILRLDHAFLEAQSDAWIAKLYEFLNGQPALRRRLDDLPLIRLEDGTHVPRRADGQPQAFLPGAVTTAFPTVRPSVCATETAREFLRSLGLTEPDPVDDVVRNVLPKYRKDDVDVADAEYEADIHRILTAFATDSKAQREKLVAVLHETPFVMAVDPGDGSRSFSRASEVYVATEHLKELFAGLAGALLVDDEQACLRGQDVRDLLEACGALRHLRPIEDTSLSWEERKELRTQAGHEGTSGQNDHVTDWSLLGLKRVLEELPKVETEQRRTRARLLWEELAHLEERRGKSVFTGEYTWTHYGSYRTSFDAAFVRMLNTMEWVSDPDGKLQRPELVLFDSLGWKPNPFLLSKVRFKPPIIEQLAKEAGIEPGVLDLLKRHGVTSVAELVARLGLVEEPAPGAAQAGPEPVEEAISATAGVATTPPKTPAGADQGGESGIEAGSDTVDRRHKAGDTGRAGPREEQEDDSGSAAGTRTPETPSARTFISYVGVHPDDEEPDPDGLGQQERMAVEARAIELILSREPEWRRTPIHNPGYDLYREDEGGGETQWCEVKAMTGSLKDRPVGLSRTQFDCACEHGKAYWLYVVERAGTSGARIVRIQDPAGKARTFTFDRGWIGVAETDGPTD